MAPTSPGFEEFFFNCQICITGFDPADSQKNKKEC